MDLSKTIEQIIRKGEESVFTKELFLYIFGITLVIGILIFIIMNAGTKKAGKMGTGLNLERLPKTRPT